MTEETPRVWIGSLTAYNNGNLLGDWFDAIDCPTDAREWVDAMIERSQRGEHERSVPKGWLDADEIQRNLLAEIHEEIWVFDHEGFGSWLKGETSPAAAQELAGMIEAIDQDGYDPDLVAEWAEYTGTTVTEWDKPTREAFDDAYCGTWRSVEEYAQDLAESIGAIDSDASWPLSYIDWERAARDLMMDYYTFVTPEGVAIFRA